MPLHLTAAQLRALGIPAGAAAQPGPAPAPKARSVRPAAAGRTPAPVYHTVCYDCAEHFHSQAAETRHLHATRHANYQLVLDLEGGS